MPLSFLRNDACDKLSLITDYAARLTGVTDDFWEEHIFGADFYAIALDDQKIGSFTVHGGDRLTSFSIDDRHLALAQDAFKKILAECGVKKAFVATCDELFLSLCLDFHKKIELQAYLFDGSTPINVRPPEYGREGLKEIEPDEIDEVNRQTDGFFSHMTKAQLTARACTIYRISDQGETLGYGVIVPDKTRPHLWACGMIVLPELRRRGVGRSILIHLADICRENGKTPISGCWYHNHLSKKTIESAGKVTRTRLLNVRFE